MVTNKLFFDTNILMDLFDKKRKEHKAAVTLVFVAHQQKLKITCSTKSVLDFYYLQKSNAKAKKMVKEIEGLFLFVDTSSSAIKKTFELDLFKDFEDGVQYEIAKENKTDYIISNDKKGFKNSEIPVKSAREMIEILAG